MKRRAPGLAVIVAALLSGAGAGSAIADVVIGNMPGNDGTQSSLLENGRIKAMGFAMQGESFALESVTLRLGIAGSDADPLVRIFADDSGVPADVLLTLENPASLEAGTESYEFRAPAPFMLEAGTTYWLVVYNTGGSSMSWLASSPAELPTGIATHAGSLFSSITGPNPPDINSTTINSYEISTCGATFRADLNADGVLDADDFFLFLQYFAAGDTRADITNDGVIDSNDFFIFLNKFVLGC